MYPYFLDSAHGDISGRQTGKCISRI